MKILAKTNHQNRDSDIDDKITEIKTYSYVKNNN